MKITYLILVAGLVLGAGLVAGCSTPGEASDSLKIGVVASMTGPASTTGRDIWQSAQLAADEINAKGGITVGGKQTTIELVQGDDESTREGGIKAVTKMITDDRVDLLTGGFSSAVVTAHQAFVAENGVPYIITGASSPTVTHRTDITTSVMFHHCPTTDDYGAKTIQFVDEVMRPSINGKFNRPADQPLRLAMIYQDSPYGKGVLSAVNDTIAKEGLRIEIVAEEPYKMGETDYRTILTQVKATNPDVVYAAAFLNEQVPMMTQARRDVGLDTIFLAVECNDDPDYYKGLGQYGEASIIESRFSPYVVPRGPIGPAVEQYQKDYAARFTTSPGMMGAATYEGVYVAAAAAEAAGSTEKGALVEALRTVRVPEMIESMENGTISFENQFRESRSNLYMEQLHWDTATQELRPKVVWPAALAETDFQLPDWYRPGGA